MFGGVFLLYLYFHWLFLEKKEPLFIERYLKEKHGVWFFAFAAISLVVIMYLAKASPMVMLAAAIGSATFFILYGLKETAESSERNLMAGSSGLSDLSKFVYLEVLDTTFSFDGVVGAFAFTINLLLILIGLGIGAIVVRELTIKGIDTIGKYKYLKNGALTSIGFLGLFMLVESFGIELPTYIPTIVTFIVIGIAFYKSRQMIKSIQPKTTKQTIAP
jgi:hypothetical protein